MSNPIPDFGNLSDRDILVYLATATARAQQDISSLSSRVSSLEKWRWQLVGWAAGLGAAGGTVGASLLPMLVKLLGQ